MESWAASPHLLRKSEHGGVTSLVAVPLPYLKKISANKGPVNG